MDIEVIDARIKKVFVESLHITPDQYNLNALIVDDFGADSLDAVELIMALEEEFNIEIPDEEAHKALSVNDVVDLVKARMRPTPL
jgi:acyl carrier protein